MRMENGKVVVASVRWSRSNVSRPDLLHRCAASVRMMSSLLICDLGRNDLGALRRLMTGSAHLLI